MNAFNCKFQAYSFSHFSFLLPQSTGTVYLLHWTDILLIFLLLFTFKDDVGMTSQHKKILRRNADKLHHVNLDKLVKQLPLSGLLDEEDKQNLLNHAKPAYDRMQMLLTDILPRRGPTAFHALLKGLEKVDPSMAHMLQQDAGMTGTIIYSDIIGWCAASG